MRPRIEVEDDSYWFQRRLACKVTQDRHRKLTKEDYQKKMFAKEKMYIISPPTCPGHPAFRRISLTEPEEYWEGELQHG